MDIDVLGSFNTIKATIPYLLQRPDPRIIFLSATFYFTGMPLQAHVSAAKSGVDSLMASVALEYGPRGVTSNVISPGGIANTEGLSRLESSDEEERRLYTKAIPSGRLGTVRDVADATVFLFSNAGSYINGQVLAVDGAAWRRQGAIGVGIDNDMEYPDFLTTGQTSQHLRGGRKAKEPDPSKL